MPAQSPNSIPWVLLTAAALGVGYFWGTVPVRDRDEAAPLSVPPPPAPNTKQPPGKFGRLELVDANGQAVCTMYEHGGRTYMIVKDGSRFQTIDLAAAARALR